MVDREQRRLCGRLVPSPPLADVLGLTRSLTGSSQLEFFWGASYHSDLLISTLRTRCSKGVYITEPGVIFPQYSPVFSNVVALYVIHEDCTVFEPKPRATAACSCQDAKSHRRLVLSSPRPGTTINHSMVNSALY